MNSILKGLLIFIGGVAVGGGATYFMVNSINEEKKDKEISDKVEAAVREYKAHELSKLNHDIKENIKSAIIKDEPEKVDDRQIDIFEYTKKIRDAGYSAYASSVKEPDEAPDDVVLERHNAFDDSKLINEDDISEDEEDEDEPGETAVKKAPYLISPDQFQNDYTDEYDKESLILFKDNILTDENFAEVSFKDAEKLLGGPKLFTAFGSKGAKKDTVYIRNELHHTDYEIVRSPRKYVTDVLHMEDEDEE